VQQINNPDYPIRKLTFPLRNSPTAKGEKQITVAVFRRMVYLRTLVPKWSKMNTPQAADEKADGMIDL
jgi:hypothetical protein